MTTLDARGPVSFFLETFAINGENCVAKPGTGNGAARGAFARGASAPLERKNARIRRACRIGSGGRRLTRTGYTAQYYRRSNRRKHVLSGQAQV